MQDPNGAPSPAQTTQGEGGLAPTPPGAPRSPGQGSAPPHYLLLQSRLHPSTPNRDYRPSTVSNCPDSDQAGPSPPPHTPGCPTSVPWGRGGCLLLWQLGTRGPGWGSRREDTAPTARLTESWSLGGAIWGPPRRASALLVSGSPRLQFLPPSVSVSGCASPPPPQPAHLAAHIR